MIFREEACVRLPRDLLTVEYVQFHCGKRVVSCRIHSRTAIVPYYSKTNTTTTISTLRRHHLNSRAANNILV